MVRSFLLKLNRKEREMVLTILTNHTWALFVASHRRSPIPDSKVGLLYECAQAIITPLHELPRLMVSENRYVQAIVEWRLMVSV